MTPVETLRTAFDLLDRHDLDAVERLMASDFRIHHAGSDDVVVGTEAWRGGTDYLLSAFPDLGVRVDDAFAGEDDRVTCLMTLTGTHRGEFLGVPATGRSVTWPSYEVYRVRDGVLTEEWILSDLHALLSQITG